MKACKTKSVNLRVPLDVYARVQAEADRQGPGVSCYRVMLELIAKVGVEAAVTSTVATPPDPHKYPEALKYHSAGDIEIDEYGNAYVLVGDKFQYKGESK